MKRFVSKQKPKLGSMQEQMDVEHITYEDRGKAKVFSIDKYLQARSGGRDTDGCDPSVGRDTCR